MNRRQTLKTVLLAPLLGLFKKETGTKPIEKLDNCGIKVTRRKDGGIIIDGDKCELKRPKKGFSAEHGDNAIILKDFVLKNERYGNFRVE